MEELFSCDVTYSDKFLKNISNINLLLSPDSGKTRGVQKNFAVPIHIDDNHFLKVSVTCELLKKNQTHNG